MIPRHQEQLKIMREGNAPDVSSGLFGYDFPADLASLVILPVPWEPTASYKKGTRNTPKKIIPASHQLDLFDPFFGNIFEKGIAWEESIYKKVNAKDKGSKTASQNIVHDINKLSDEVNNIVSDRSLYYLNQGKKVAVLGGDHSSPFGLIKALGKIHPDGFGILHIDAHHDLRYSYQGYKHSHASIMYNIITEIPQVRSLVSVGIRDFSQDEFEFAQNPNNRIHTFYWDNIFENLCNGTLYTEIVNYMINLLPKKIYISFDIDGLDSKYCPNTGTPVPGGLSFDQANLLMKKVVQSGKEIIGFDLCEVSPSPNLEDDWDLNVGSRVLYKLCGATLFEK